MGSATVQTQRGLQAERISALVDGEFDPDELAALLDEADTSGRPLWDDYHLIGDALRSDELTLPRSESAFMASFAARLEAEPHLLAPAALADAQASAAQTASNAGSRITRINPFLRVRRVLPTAAAAAAVAALSWVVVPRLQDHPAGGAQPQVLAQTATPAAAAGTNLTRVTLTQQPQAVAAAANGAGPNDLIVLRDARLDQYLAAHQQYAPAPIGQGVSPYMRASAQADE
ncbi:anti-sigma factor [Pandoraea pneumonica]|jgi:sigma-E factor negative regulatory protein RseA|uniref:Anti-sigma factor n=1 Tax=Pandoraea pneumonica TaxID=2508299 RepID=A0A5E4WXL4_9BURK|nr:sigma-E factor negative regulatory protein [Pandoraea pneumonica]VVE29033.1 anti-sigma factor [Pandoraea pneumonica]